MLLKPSPIDVVEQYFDSLRALGIDPREHDLRLVEDDWESPTLGAAGVGWQVWMDGQEISQFTYFQQCGGLELPVVSAELTYGLDRIGMMLQGTDRVQDLVWSPGARAPTGGCWRARVLGRPVAAQRGRVVALQLRGGAGRGAVRDVQDVGGRGRCACSACELVSPGYDAVIKCSHLFNLLDARGAISVSERVGYIGRVRKLARAGRGRLREAARRAGLPADPGRGRAREWVKSLRRTRARRAAAKRAAKGRPAS